MRDHTRRIEILAWNLARQGGVIAIVGHALRDELRSGNVRSCKA